MGLLFQSIIGAHSKEGGWEVQDAVDLLFNNLSLKTSKLMAVVVVVVIYLVVSTCTFKLMTL